LSVADMVGGEAIHGQLSRQTNERDVCDVTNGDIPQQCPGCQETQANKA